MSKPTLLVIDDDRSFLDSLSRALRWEYEVYGVCSARDAERYLAPLPDLVLLDLRLDEDDPTNREALTLLQSLHQCFPALPILMVTAYGDVETAVECMKLGAVDFVQKQAGLAEIKTRIAQALRASELDRRLKEAEQHLQRIEPRQIVGNSPKMQEIRRFIEAVARDGNVTVLIRGETGTGKELVARAIHASGRRQSGPFVPVMLNAIPYSMMEAELFGYEAGAFTDAKEPHTGYLERAHRGVLFLDEIGEVDPNIQVKLLRFLEEREFQRLGSTNSIRVDVQVIAATNADLEERVRNGLFREDLYFRLKVHEIVLPPLRERKEDIPLLVEHFLHLFRQQGKRVARISPQAVEVLEQFHWPGNVRQLRNALESALFWAEVRGHSQIEVEDLPADVRQPPNGGPQQKPQEIAVNGDTVYEVLARTELALIEQALQSAQGKKTEAWKLLGYHDRFALYRRVKRILQQYPHLRQEFPTISEKFQF